MFSGNSEHVCSQFQYLPHQLRICMSLFRFIRHVRIGYRTQCLCINFVIGGQWNSIDRDPCLRFHIVRKRLLNMCFYRVDHKVVVIITDNKTNQPGTRSGNMNDRGFRHIVNALCALLYFSQLNPMTSNFNLRIFATNDFDFTIWKIASQITGLVYPPKLLCINKTFLRKFGGFKIPFGNTNTTYMNFTNRARRAVTQFIVQNHHCLVGKWSSVGNQIGTQVKGRISNGVIVRPN